MRNYELVLILKSSLAESARKKLLDTIRGWFKDVKFIKEDAWGEKALSYAIKGEKSGYYYVLSMEGSSMAAEYEKKLTAQENILRYLLIRKK